MSRKVISIIVAGLLLSACVFFYLRLRKENEPAGNALMAIPTDAAFIIESRQTSSLYHTVDGSNMMWEDMRSLPAFSHLRNGLHELDSLLRGNEKMHDVTEGHSLFISAHPFENGLEYLFAFAIPASYTTRQFDDFLHNHYTVRNKPGEILSLSTNRRNEIGFYAIVKGVLLISASENLLKKAIQQSNALHSLADDTAFHAAQVTAKSSKFDLRLFLHFPDHEFWPKSFLNERFSDNLQKNGPFAGWTALDMNVRPQSILMNGFCSVDPAKDYLALFHDQEPQRAEAIIAMPSSTTSFIHFGYSNFQNYFTAYSKRRSPDVQTSLDSINKKYETDFGSDFSSLIENETVILHCDCGPETPDPGSSVFVLLRSENIEHADKKLQELCAQVCKKDALRNDTIPCGKHIICQLKAKRILPLLFGRAYAVTENYYTTIGNYMLFGNSPDAIKNYLKMVDGDHTLSKDSHYNKFSANLASKSNIYFYSNIARSRTLYPDYVENSIAEEIQKRTDLMLRFEALGVQFSSSGDLFYNTSYIEENPLYKKEITSLWETRIDTVFNSRPQLLVNHLNNTLDIFVQDEAHKIYLISNTGKILWSKSLPEKIMSPVYQVDVFKNDKLQMLFNTRSTIYMLDRNGNTVDGFPLAIPSGASNALAMMDYEHKKEYRLLIACMDKHIRNFTIKGKSVDGWSEPVTSDTVRAPLLHTFTGSKDYLVTADISGQPYVFDRHGEALLKIQDRLPSPLFKLNAGTGKDPGHTWLIAADTLGNITRISLSGKTEHIPFKQFTGQPFFLYNDMNGDKNSEYIFLGGNELSVFTQDKSLLFSYTFSDSTGLRPFYILKPDGHGSIGVVAENAGELYLLNESGTQPAGFPLRGTVPFSIGDLNHNNTLQLISGEGKNIYAYALP